MGKELKTNAMRILDREKVSYEILTYECDEFVDAIHVADVLGQPYEISYKTLVALGKSGAYCVFVVPIAEELDLKKAAASVGEKAVSLIPVKDITAVTGYVRGGCTPIGMKKPYRTVIHITAQTQPIVLVSGGRIGTHIRLSPSDLARVTKATFVDIIL